MTVFLVIMVLILLLAVVLAVKTAMFRTVMPVTAAEASAGKAGRAGASEKLSKAVSIKTISNIDYSKVDWEEFEKYKRLMKELFPLVHSKLEREVVNGYSLVYRWKGKHAERRPVLVTAHMDVVPVEKGTEQDWIHAPFSGDIAGGFVWGRGTLDTKIHMITALEAVEQSLREGFVPERDIYFAFGHDEEIGGLQGAQKIVELLQTAQSVMPRSRWP
jgi:carboxypeptidase PM20D1